MSNLGKRLEWRGGVGGRRFVRTGPWFRGVIAQMILFLKVVCRCQLLCCSGGDRLWRVGVEASIGVVYANLGRDSSGRVNNVNRPPRIGIEHQNAS